MKSKPSHFNTHFGRLLRARSMPAGLSLGTAWAERHWPRRATAGTDPTPGARTDPSRFGGQVLSYFGAPSHPPTSRADDGSANMQAAARKIIQRFANGRPLTRLSPSAPECRQNGPRAHFEPSVTHSPYQTEPARAVRLVGGLTT